MRSKIGYHNRPLEVQKWIQVGSTVDGYVLVPPLQGNSRRFRSFAIEGWLFNSGPLRREDNRLSQQVDLQAFGLTRNVLSDSRGREYEKCGDHSFVVNPTSFRDCCSPIVQEFVISSGVPGTKSRRGSCA